MKVTSGSPPASKYSSAMRISSIIYFLISVGVALQISGSNWDIVWHGIGNVETFFTPPHSVIYSGVVLVIGSVVVGIIHTTKISQQKNIPSKRNIFGLLTVSLPLPIKLAIIGCTLQLTAGPFDFWWHNQFGFDGLLSPPHSVLATGMLMAALGALIGIYYHYRGQNNNSTSCSIFSGLSLILAFAVFLLVGVGMVLMFTLPFSKGQYFDFNPNPVAAVVAASTFIPFIIGLCLFVAVKISAFSTNNKRIPFMLTSIIAVIMIIQSTTTITSNSYFAWLFPLYLLNILPAIVADILIYSYLQKKKSEISITSSLSSSSYSAQSFSLNSKVTNPNNNTTTIKLCLIASMIVSIFYATLFFPWTIDVYGGYFKPPNTLRTEEFFVQLLIPVILPIAVPVSVLSSMTGGLIGQKLMNIRKSIA
ncbi:MAG TPA: hypothetical protein VFS97_04160 [Nitrososphaeraceae archaeon]|nr:hypothetical protein [Nitrososphaeraceae archaeon]